MAIFAVILFFLSLPVLFWAGYLAVLTVLSKRLPEPEYGPAKRTFAIVIPAHDEEEGIETTVRSLLLLDYPQELFQVTVVADNCTDRTADKALRAGAAVLVRKDESNRGKGFALKYAFDTLMDGDAPDAFVVIDADTTAAPNLLRAFQARLDAGEVAVQAEYSVRNPDASWRTRLMVIALALFHAVRSLARERLGLSVGLRGNGMCFSKQILQEVPHDAFSIVEDLEYGIRLGRAGHRVAYAHDGLVLGEMVAGEKASRSQRRRWEAGRVQIAKQYLVPLLREAYEKKSKLLLDLAMDLLVPPLSIVATAAFVGAVLALALTSWAWIPWMLSIGCIAVYVIRGVMVSGAGWRGIVDLAYAPVYVGWKLTLPLTSKANKEWVRTEREKP